MCHFFSAERGAYIVAIIILGTEVEGLRPKTRKRLLRYLKEQNFKSEYYQLTIRHDNWCSRLMGTGTCNCDPDFSVSQPQKVSEN
jgi:hypothetical protein